MSVFHQWLLAAPATPAPACAIILHCDDSTPAAHLIQDIADYLNEYDDDADGCWLPASPDLVRDLATDARHRRRLGMAEIDPTAIGNPQAEYLKTLACLVQRGHVVFRSPDSATHPWQLANTFHAAVGGDPEITEKCHLFLNSGLMDQKCIAHVIGDVFLEWLHCDLRRSTPFHELH
ncbi:MAG: hypothetical protein WCJ14_03085 [Verrucomicrobiota bacterium]